MRIPTEDAAAQVRASLAAGTPPARKLLERALRETFGLSARQAKRFAAEGARALGATDDDAMDGLLQRVRALESTLKL